MVTQTMMLYVLNYQTATTIQFFYGTGKGTIYEVANYTLAIFA